MGKIYNLCLGKIVDKTSKWQITSKPPKKDTWSNYRLRSWEDESWRDELNKYRTWEKTQPPKPEEIGICNKCGKNYSHGKLRIKKYAWPFSGMKINNQCYNRIYNNNQQQHKENNMLINQKNLILGHGIPKEIKIRNNVELPCPERGNTYSKYGFISTLEVGESFEVNGDTPGFKAKSLAPAAYAIAKQVRTTTRNKKFTVACRTVHGTCKDPLVVGVWRTA